jgi:hypothetical protein
MPPAVRRAEAGNAVKLVGSNNNPLINMNVYSNTYGRYNVALRNVEPR